MKAEIFSHAKYLGSAELQVGDETMGHLYGVLSPSRCYYTEIREYVWRFNALTVPDFDEWLPLRFNIQLENGYFIYAAGGITFDDIRDLPNEPIQVNIAGVDRHVIDDFFLSPGPRPFVKKPWEPISIEQKLLFEDELRIEVGIKKNKASSVSKFLNVVNTHPLADFYFSALSQDSRCDDILFVSRKDESEAQFAVIHLTWKGYKEPKDLPKSTFYKDFDEFKYLKMYPDKADWDN